MTANGDWFKASNIRFAAGKDAKSRLIKARLADPDVRGSAGIRGPQGRVLDGLRPGMRAVPYDEVIERLLAR